MPTNEALWRRRLLLVGGGLVLLVMTAPWLCAYLSFSGYSLRRLTDARFVGPEYDVPPAPFDREKWDTEAARYRVGMAKTIVRDRLLIGKAREEVIALLGPPTHDDRWLLAIRETSLFPYHDFLVAKYGPDGRVTEAYTYTQD
jgi:hypothetical protein